MKSFIKIIIILSLLVSGTVAFGYVANNGYLNNQLQHLLKYYLKLKGVDAEITNFHYQGGVINIDNISFNNDTNISAEKIVIKYTLGDVVSKFNIHLDIMVDQLSIKDNDGRKVIKTKMQVNYNSNLLQKYGNCEITLPAIEIDPDISDKISNFNIGTGKVTYKRMGANKKYNAKIAFAEDSFLDINLVQNTNEVVSDIQVNNIPLMLYKLLYSLAPDNNLLKELKIINSGFITKGKLRLKLDKEYFKTGLLTENNLYSNFQFKDVNVKFDPKMPMAKAIKAEMLQYGHFTKIYVNKGSIANIDLTEGIVKIERNKIGELDLIISANAKGKMADLTNFIHKDAREKLQKEDIDFYKFTGQIEGTANIIIPLKNGDNDSKREKILDIKVSTITNAGVKIFDDQLILSNSKINGKYDGKQLVFQGEGKVNGYDSIIDFVYNFKDKSKFEYCLNTRSFVQHKRFLKNRDQKIGLFTVLGGKTSVDFEYKFKDEKRFVTIESDLKNIGLYLDKLGIKKEQGHRGRLSAKGVFNDLKVGSLNFNITGENNLDISGTMQMKNNETQVIIPKIKYLETDLNAEITDTLTTYKISVFGKTLDLSTADMIGFLEKESLNNKQISLIAKIDNIKLRDNIWLTNLDILLKCLTNCYEGNITAKIGSRDVDIKVTNGENQSEKWVVNCSNAGALLKGLGIYSTMKTGKLDLVVNTRRREAQTGEIIPVIDGTFTFKKFILKDTPTITRLVSFISLPGILNAVTNNRDIRFRRMSGKFSFKDRILSINSSFADGPYFSFTLAGAVDTNTKLMNIKGRISPSLYGVDSIPLIGGLIVGDKKSRGLISAPYKLKQNYDTNNK
ncbi:MAG: hypothetical protein HRU35_06255 [Rickettsiaceae bacterium]|nr:hypothetical protein [Rickettsiaceae bacterium]